MAVLWNGLGRLSRIRFECSRSRSGVHCARIGLTGHYSECCRRCRLPYKAFSLTLFLLRLYEDLSGPDDIALTVASVVLGLPAVTHFAPEGAFQPTNSVHVQAKAVPRSHGPPLQLASTVYNPIVFSNRAEPRHCNQSLNYCISTF